MLHFFSKNSVLGSFSVFDGRLDPEPYSDYGSGPRLLKNQQKHREHIWKFTADSIEPEIKNVILNFIQRYETGLILLNSLPLSPPSY